MKLSIKIFLWMKLITLIKSDDKKPPHIIVIVIDDLGKEHNKEFLGKMTSVMRNKQSIKERVNE